MLTSALATAFDRLHTSTRASDGTYLRGHYSGHSRTTAWRHAKQKQEEMQRNAKENYSITKFFKPFGSTSASSSSSVTPLSDESLVLQDISDGDDEDFSEDEHSDAGDFQEEVKIIDARDKEQLAAIIEDLQASLASFKNNQATRPEADKAHEMRYLTVKLYVTNMLDQDMSMSKASVQAAKALVERKENMTHRSFVCKSIRHWAREFAECGYISKSNRGRHVKRISFLSQEEVREKCIEWQRGVKPMERDIQAFKSFIDNELAPSYNEGKPGNVSIRTIRRYLHLWGFKYRKNTKGIYVDGHERDDVMEYRYNWSKRMMVWKKAMEEYDGENMGETVQPNLDGPFGLKQTKVLRFAFDDLFSIKRMQLTFFIFPLVRL